MARRGGDNAGNFLAAMSRHPAPPSTGSARGGRRESRWIPALARLIKGKIAPRIAAKSTPGLKEIQAIRKALHQCVADCNGPPVLRLRHKIEHAATVQDLWMLRNDAYQLISHQHSQNVAAERINALMAVFKGWVDPRQLVHIR